jgi:hypothetical protein
MVPTKTMADMYLSKDGLPITQSALFKGYNTLTSEFQDRDPRMSMTFIEPGSNIFLKVVSGSLHSLVLMEAMPQEPVI